MGLCLTQATTTTESVLDPGSPQYRSLLSPLEEEEPSGLEVELAGIRAEITVIADKIRADAATAKLESEWKFAAMVNLFFIDLSKLT